MTWRELRWSLWPRLDSKDRPSHLVDVHVRNSLENKVHDKPHLMRLLEQRLNVAPAGETLACLCVRWVTIRMRQQWGRVLINYAFYFEAMWDFLVAQTGLTDNKVQALLQHMRVMPFHRLPEFIRADLETADLINYLNYTLWLLDFKHTTSAPVYIACNAELWESFVKTYLRCRATPAQLDNVKSRILLTLADYQPQSAEHCLLHRVLLLTDDPTPPG